MADDFTKLDVNFDEPDPVPNSGITIVPIHFECPSEPIDMFAVADEEIPEFLVRLAENGDGCAVHEILSDAIRKLWAIQGHEKLAKVLALSIFKLGGIHMLGWDQAAAHILCEFCDAIPESDDE